MIHSIGSGLLLVADPVHVLSDIVDPVVLAGHPAECNHFACLAFEGTFDAVSPGSNGLLLVCGGEHGGRTSLADIELDGADLHAQALLHQILQIFSGAGQHLVAECIYAYIAGKLTDESSLSVVDPFGDADNQVRCCLQGCFDFTDKCLLVKSRLREIDQNRVVPLEFSGEGAGGS